MNRKFAGLILAGGMSRRMSGKHKGSLLIKEGKTFTEQISDEMHKLTDLVYISYGDEIQETPDNCVIVKDIFPDCGPIGGLHSALRAAQRDGVEAVLTSACDMPFVKAELYLFLYNQLEQNSKFTDYDGAVATVDGRIHPLAAIYRVRAAALFEKQLIDNNRKVRDAVQKLHILYVDLTETPYVNMLVNINTEQDYRSVLINF